MPPPVAVYVVAAVVGVAAIFAFKEFVYEPHLAPKLEAWAESYLQRRRAARNRRANAVPVRTSPRRRDSSSSSDPSHDDDDNQRNRCENHGELGPNDLFVDGLELEALASREVDEWRNEVLRSQERTQDGLRNRRKDRFRNDFDGFDSTSTTLDESFTSLTHTPLASTHVISNLSSPITPSAASLPPTPTRRLRSASQSTATRGDGAPFVLLHSPPSSTHEMPTMSPSTFPSSAVQTPCPPANTVDHVDITSSTPIAVHHPHPSEGAPHLLPSTPTHQVLADDSPFGPLLPDTPRSMAEMYGERPFSPITRVMGPSGNVSAAGPEGTYLSRSDSMNSLRTLGGSGVPRKRSGLVNEVMTNFRDDDEDEENHPQRSAAAFTQENTGPGMNESVISSLSERYPPPPTPPVIVSPPASSVGLISAPSSPRSGDSEVVVHHDVQATLLRSPAPPQALPLLQLPFDSSSPRLMSRSRSSADSATSPALSYASFLSPMPISRGASESEGDEFMSVASDDSDWSVPPVTPSGGPGPVHDRANNPFIDFEHVARGVRGSDSEHGDGSERSEVLLADLAQEGESEVGSDESWGSARRH